MNKIQKEMCFDLDGNPVFQGFPKEWTVKDQIAYLDLFSRDGKPENPARIPQANQPSMEEGIFQVILVCNPPQQGETPKQHELRHRAYWKVQRDITDFPEQPTQLIQFLQKDLTKYRSVRSKARKLLAKASAVIVATSAILLALVLSQASLWITLPAGTILGLMNLAAMTSAIVCISRLAGDRYTLMSTGSKACLIKLRFQDLESCRDEIIGILKECYEIVDSRFVPSMIRQQVWKNITDLEHIATQEESSQDSPLMNKLLEIVRRPA